jgi:cation diffusion facilitator CzcD-associated flavoprotein CzcO
MPVGEWVRGRDGKRLADVWQGSPRAHLGAMVAGFPNLFCCSARTRASGTARWST